MKHGSEKSWHSLQPAAEMYISPQPPIHSSSSASGSRWQKLRHDCPVNQPHVSMSQRRAKEHSAGKRRIHADWRGLGTNAYSIPQLAVAITMLGLRCGLGTRQTR
jgi:hypothetical protein